MIAALASMAFGGSAQAQEITKQDWGTFKLWIDPGHSRRRRSVVVASIVLTITDPLRGSYPLWCYLQAALIRSCEAFHIAPRLFFMFLFFIPFTILQQCIIYPQYFSTEPLKINEFSNYRFVFWWGCKKNFPRSHCERSEKITLTNFLVRNCTISTIPQIQIKCYRLLYYEKAY